MTGQPPRQSTPVPSSFTMNSCSSGRCSDGPPACPHGGGTGPGSAARINKSKQMLSSDIASTMESTPSHLAFTASPADSAASGAARSVELHPSLLPAQLPRLPRSAATPRHLGLQRWGEPARSQRTSTLGNRLQREHSGPGRVGPRAAGAGLDDHRPGLPQHNGGRAVAVVPASARDTRAADPASDEVSQLLPLGAVGHARHSGCAVRSARRRRAQPTLPNSRTAHTGAPAAVLTTEHDPACTPGTSTHSGGAAAMSGATCTIDSPGLELDYSTGTRGAVVYSGWHGHDVQHAGHTRGRSINAESGGSEPAGACVAEARPQARDGASAAADDAELATPTLKRVLPISTSAGPKKRRPLVAVSTPPPSPLATSGPDNMHDAPAPGYIPPAPNTALPEFLTPHVAKLAIDASMENAVDVNRVDCCGQQHHAALQHTVAALPRVPSDHVMHAYRQPPATDHRRAALAAAHMLASVPGLAWDSTAGSTEGSMSVSEEVTACMPDLNVQISGMCLGDCRFPRTPQ
eukprot:jgi/Ulvmu1/5720/UM024_0073.1